jgi:predicted MPP superfamily phosphohydrolase
MKLAWLTDVHLNFLDKSGRKKFYQQIVASQVEAVLISVDIAEAPSVSDILKEMIEQIQMPIYFVLGNHDYYRGNIKDVREQMILLNQGYTNLFWLPASGVQLMNLTVETGKAEYYHPRIEIRNI